MKRKGCEQRRLEFSGLIYSSDLCILFIYLLTGSKKQNCIHDEVKNRLLTTIRLKDFYLPVTHLKPKN
jgi:hypothetical protein